MREKPDILDAVVVGAGWAGRGISGALAAAGIRHRVLERDRIAETWRTQRWDSFSMNIPRLMTVMPGDRYEGPEPDGFQTCDEFIALLDDYAVRKSLPVQTMTTVTQLTRSEEEGTYRLSTSRGEVFARNVVIATGTFNCPVRPASAATLPPTLAQLDTSGYRNAASLPAGAVLVVGSGQSGGQIAEDLIRSGRMVFLSTSQVGRAPRRYRGRDVVFWMVASGLFDVPRKDFVDARGRPPTRPLIGAVRTISLQSLSSQGAILLGRFVGFEDGCLRFADDVAHNVRFADDYSAKARSHIDDYIARSGLRASAALDDPDEAVRPRIPEPPLLSIDPREHGITTVVWCTGFEGDFRWVDVPGVLNLGN